jgi:uncharacterized membrane protein YecN with MAPEG domain
MITSLFAGLLGLIYILITINVIRTRRRLKISLGDDGNPEMQKAISAHSNFHNYVPIFLILLYLIEVNQFVPSSIIIAIGSIFTLGRVLHFRGIVQNNFKLRVPGMMMTIFPITLCSLISLFARFFL